MSERPSPSTSAPHIVIVAAHEDEQFALKLWDAIGKCGVAVSINDVDIFRGEATHLVAILSDEAAQSRELADQVSVFREQSGGQVFTVRRSEEVVLPEVLKSERGTSGFLVPVATPKEFGPVVGERAQLRAAAQEIAKSIGVTPPSFLKRHLTATVGSALAACLIIAVGFAGVSLNRAELAEAQYAQAVQLGDQLLSALAAEFPTSASGDQLIALSNGVDQALSSLDFAAADTNALSQYASIYHAIGEVRDLHGEPRGAQLAFERAHEISGAILVAAPDDPQAMFAHSQSAFWAGNSAYRAGNLDTAQLHFATYANLAERLVEIDPSNSLYAAELGHAANNSGVIALERGEAREAATYFETAITIFEGSPLADGHISTSDIANSRGWRADALSALGQLSAAAQERLLEASTYERALSGSPGDSELEWALANSRFRAAQIMAQQGRDDEADAILEPALEASAQLVAEHPQNIRFARLYVTALWQRARLAFWRGDTIRAQLLLGEVSRYMARVDEAGQNDARHLDRGYVSLLSAEIALHAGALEDARADATEAILAGEQAILAGYESARSLLAVAYFTQGEALSMSGDTQSAMRSYRAVQTNIAALPTATTDLETQDLLARARWRLDDAEEALAIREELIELRYARSDFIAFWAAEGAALNANTVTPTRGDDRG